MLEYIRYMLRVQGDRARGGGCKGGEGHLHLLDQERCSDQAIGGVRVFHPDGILLPHLFQDGDHFCHHPLFAFRHAGSRINFHYQHEGKSFGGG